MSLGLDDVVMQRRATPETCWKGRAIRVAQHNGRPPALRRHRYTSLSTSVTYRVPLSSSSSDAHSQRKQDEPRIPVQ